MIADVGGSPADPSPDPGDAGEAEAALETARDRMPWRFENRLVAIIDLAMLVAIPALFLMAMLALVIPL